MSNIKFFIATLHIAIGGCVYKIDINIDNQCRNFYSWFITPLITGSEDFLAVQWIKLL